SASASSSSIRASRNSTMVMCSSFHSPVGAGLGGVLQFPVPANMGTALGALVGTVALDVGVRFGLHVPGYVLVAAVRAAPFLACEHGQVGVVLDPGAQPVVYGFGGSDVAFVILLDLLLRFLVAVAGCTGNVYLVLVGFRFHPEPLAERVECVRLERKLGPCDLEGVHGFPRSW